MKKLLNKEEIGIPQSDLNQIKESSINLVIDIDEVSKRINTLSNDIEILRRILTDIDSKIQEETDKIIKKSLYISYNSTFERICRLEELLQNYMNIKLNYRKEQDDLIIKKVKLIEIDYKKAHNIDTEDNPMNLIHLLKDIDKNVNKEKSSYLNSVISDLDDDPTYTLR
jgi:hypothetical protein